jgi:2-aminoadipate transaminase
MKADDPDGRVVYLSSFSKTLAPGFRVAWIDAPPPLAAKLEFAKQAGDLCSGILDQRLVYETARRGILDRQLPLLRAHYREKRDVMVETLQRELGADVTWPAPRGGFFLWAALPAAIDADRLIERAVRHGVVYVAGQAFFVNGPGEPQGAAAAAAVNEIPRNLMRLSFSAPSHDRIREGVSRLAAAVREELAALLTASARPGRPAR